MWRQEYNGGLNVLLSPDSWCCEVFDIRGKMWGVVYKTNIKTNKYLV